MKTFEMQMIQDVEHFLQYVIESNGLTFCLGFYQLMTLPTT